MIQLSVWTYLPNKSGCYNCGIKGGSLIVVINLTNSLGCLLGLFRINAKTIIMMGSSRTNSTSTQNPAKKKEGSNHLVECTWPGFDGRAASSGPTSGNQR